MPGSSLPSILANFLAVSDNLGSLNQVKLFLLSVKSSVNLAKREFPECALFLTFMAFTS